MATEYRNKKDEIQLAILMVGNERYALDIMRIKEIQRQQTITRIPKVPDFVEGVIHVRGAVIPIVDMRKRLDLPATEYSRKTRIVIANLGGKIVGLLVDEVNEVIRVDRASIGAAPSLTRGIGAEYIKGVVRYEEHLILLLDYEKVLSTEEKVRIGKVKQDAQKAIKGDGKQKKQGDSNKVVSTS